MDSRLVANHVLGEYEAKDEHMIQYLEKTKSLIQNFDRFTIKQVPRGDNRKADALSKIASTSFAHLSKQVLVETLQNKSILEMEVSAVIEEEDPTWMTPIIEFISKGSYHKIISTLEECGAQRSDLNYEITSSIDVLSCNLGSDVLDFFNQTMYSERSTLDHVACTQDHGLL